MMMLGMKSLGLLIFAALLLILVVGEVSSAPVESTEDTGDTEDMLDTEDTGDTLDSPMTRNSARCHRLLHNNQKQT